MSERIAVLRTGKSTAPAFVSLMKVAHVSGNTVDALHCPFCGSGSVTARSDGTIECGFCTAAYTVQVQPQYAAFPQTINDAPYPWPGREDEAAMGPDGMGMDEEGGLPPELGGEEEEDGDQPPWMAGGDSDEEDDDEDEDEDEDGPEASVGGSPGPPPFTKKKSARTYRTAFGSLVEREDYLDHLAMVTSDQPDRTAMLIKAERPA